MEAAGCRIIEYPDKDAEFSIYLVADQHLLNRDGMGAANTAGGKINKLKSLVEFGSLKI